MQRHNWWGRWWYRNKGKRFQQSLKPIGYRDRLCAFQKQITISSKCLLRQIPFSFVLLPPLISLVQYIFMHCIICFNWFHTIYMSVRWNNSAKKERIICCGCHALWLWMDCCRPWSSIYDRNFFLFIHEVYLPLTDYVFTLTDLNNQWG